MHKFEELIEKFKNRYNLIVVSQIGINIAILILTLFQVFNVAFNIVSGRELELFYTALTLRVTGAMFIIYLIFATKDRFLDSKQASKEIDRLNEDKSDTFQNSYELNSTKDGVIPEFLERINQKANNRVEDTELRYPAIISKNMRVYYIFIILGHLILLIAFGSNFKSSWKNFYLSAMPKNEVVHSLQITPGDSTLVTGSSLDIKIIDYDPDVEYFLNYKREMKWKKTQFTASKFQFANLDFSFDYYVENRHTKTAQYKIDVYEKPAINGIKVIYNYPLYTRMLSETDTISLGEISGLRGTKVKLIIRTNHTMKSAFMIFKDGNSIQAEELSDSHLLFNLTLAESGYYHIALENSYGEQYSSSDKSINVIPDLFPEISLSDYPDRGVMNKNQYIPFTVKASDDYNLFNLTLYSKVNDNSVDEIILIKKLSTSIINHATSLDLSSAKMFPGDEVTFWASIEDNLGKAHLVNSDKVTLRLPTLEEIFQEMEEQDEIQKELLEGTKEKSKELQEEFEEKRRELLKKDKLDWEDKKELTDMIKQQENLSDNVDESIENMEKMIEDAQKNEALTQETLAKMEKIKELMEDINSDDLKAAMEKMKEKMDEMSADDMKKALEDMKFSMEEFSEKLEQTLKMLEQLKKEQTLEKMVGLTEEMEKLQEEQLKNTESGENSEELAAKQKEIQDKLDALKEEMEKLKEMLDSPSEQQLQDELSKVQEEMESAEMSEKMEEMQEQMKSDNSSQTQQSQQDMLSEMKKMKESFMSMQSMMGSMQSEEVEQAIDLLLKELLFFASNHSDINARMDKDPFEIIEDVISSYDMVNLAINKFFSHAEVMMSISPKFMTDLTSTMKEYRELFSHVNDNKRHKVKSYLLEIQKGINTMVFDLMQSSGDQQSGGMGGMPNMMQQMEQMSQQQMAMNMMSQQLMQQLGGQKKMPGSARQQMGEMAANEQQLADNLKRMLQGNEQAQKSSTAIKGMIDELESVSRQLKRNRLDSDLIKQQENILSRMLDVTKSINKRDKSKKRKAEEGEDKNWDTPESIQQRFKELEKSALLEEEYKNYSKEYQKIILEYIKRLNRNK